MINVLVTSVGGGVGQSIVDSISHLNSDYYIVGLDLSDQVYSRNQCDEFVISPRINHPDYLNFLLLQCDIYSIDIIIPGNDGELELLSKNLKLFSKNGVSVVVSPTKIVASSRNKYNWYKDYSDIINIVPTALYEDYVDRPDDFSDIFFPVIAKPAAGSASSGIKLYLNLDQMMKDKIPDEESKNYVVQPYLMPQKNDPDYDVLKSAVSQRRLLQLSEISCQIVYNKNSEIIGIFVSKNSLKNGVPVTIEPITDRNILSIVEQVGEKLKSENVVGPVNIQGRLTESGLVFFEMNLRFTGITGNRSQLGFNEVACVINSFINPNKTLEYIQSNTVRVGARQVACTTSYPINKKSINTIFVSGASSWAAKNFIYYLCKSKLTKSHKIILSCRECLNLKNLFNNIPVVKDCLKNIVFIGVSELELSKAIALSDIVLNFTSARPPHGNTNIHKSTIFNLTLVDLIKKNNPGLVINMSSQSVYDSSENIAHSELSSTSAESVYSSSKLVVEHAFNSIARFNKGTEVINLRLGRLWSGNLDVDKTQFPFKLLDALLGGGAFNVSNPGNQISLLDVDDLSASIVRIFKRWYRGEYVPNVLNLGGVNTTLEELSMALENMLDEQGIIYQSLGTSSTDNEESSFTISSSLAEEYQLLYLTELRASWEKVLNLYHNKSN